MARFLRLLKYRLLTYLLRAEIWWKDDVSMLVACERALGRLLNNFQPILTTFKTTITYFSILRIFFVLCKFPRVRLIFYRINLCWYISPTWTRFRRILDCTENVFFLRYVHLQVMRLGQGISSPRCSPDELHSCERQRHKDSKQLMFARAGSTVVAGMDYEIFHRMFFTK